METEMQPSFMDRLNIALWALVDIAVGGPDVERRHGDDRMDDPHRLDFDLITPPQR